MPEKKAIWIPNLVNVARFALPKRPGAERTLGLLGMAPMRKRLDLALDLLQALWADDRRWRLRIKGQRPEDLPWVWQRADERAYYREQFQRIASAPWSDRVRFDPPGDDVSAWLRDIGYVLSPSDFESFHMAVGEGMASGAIPVVWDWLGSDALWPAEFVFRGVDEAAGRIAGLSIDPDLEGLGFST